MLLAGAAPAAASVAPSASQAPPPGDYSFTVPAGVTSASFELDGGSGGSGRTAGPGARALTSSRPCRFRRARRWRSAWPARAPPADRRRHRRDQRRRHPRHGGPGGDFFAVRPRVRASSAPARACSWRGVAAVRQAVPGRRRRRSGRRGRGRAPKAPPGRGAATPLLGGAGGIASPTACWAPSAEDLTAAWPRGRHRRRPRRGRRDRRHHLPAGGGGGGGVYGGGGGAAGAICPGAGVFAGACCRRWRLQ